MTTTETTEHDVEAREYLDTADDALLGSDGEKYHLQAAAAVHALLYVGDQLRRLADQGQS